MCSYKNGLSNRKARSIPVEDALIVSTHHPRERESNCDAENENRNCIKAHSLAARMIPEMQRLPAVIANFPHIGVSGLK